LKKRNRLPRNKLRQTSVDERMGKFQKVTMLFGKQCTELLYILIANKTATINENTILFDVSAYA